MGGMKWPDYWDDDHDFNVDAYTWEDGPDNPDNYPKPPARGRSTLVWGAKTGSVQIHEMDDRHLLNAHRLLREQRRDYVPQSDKEIWASALMSLRGEAAIDSIGDDPDYIEDWEDEYVTSKQEYPRQNHISAMGEEIKRRKLKELPMRSSKPARQARESWNDSHGPVCVCDRCM